jgi:hypothetical protein
VGWMCLFYRGRFWNYFIQRDSYWHQVIGLVGSLSLSMFPYNVILWGIFCGSIKMTYEVSISSHDILKNILSLNRNNTHIENKHAISKNKMKKQAHKKTKITRVQINLLGKYTSIYRK